MYFHRHIETVVERIAKRKAVIVLTVNYAEIRSFISTVKKRCLNLLNSISLVFNGQPVLC